MSEARAILPAPILYLDACLECGHPCSAVSAKGVEAAVQAHVAHVNAHLPHADDPHFEAHRIDSLILDLPVGRQ